MFGVQAYGNSAREQAGSGKAVPFSWERTMLEREQSKSSCFMTTSTPIVLTMALSSSTVGCSAKYGQCVVPGDSRSLQTFMSTLAVTDKALAT